MTEVKPVSLTKWELGETRSGIAYIKRVIYADGFKITARLVAVPLARMTIEVMSPTPIKGYRTWNGWTFPKPFVEYTSVDEVDPSNPAHLHLVEAKMLELYRSSRSKYRRLTYTPKPKSRRNRKVNT